MAPDDARRFHNLYVAHYAAVLGYCMRRLSREEAFDSAAETFVVAWRRIAEVPPGEATRPWLFRVAANTISNQRRAARRRKGLTMKLGGMRQTGGPQPDVQVVRQYEDQQIVDAINRLRPTDREVLLLSAWDGLPASQLAIRFGISAKAAEQRLTRAKRRLAAELARIEASTAPPNRKSGDVIR